MNTQNSKNSHLWGIKMPHKAKLAGIHLCAFTLTAFLAGCGTSDAFFSGSGGSTFSIGTGTGSGFVADAINIAIPTLAPQGSTTISVNVVDDSNLLYTGSATLNFSSTCSLQNLASFSVSQVTTTTGTATVDYTDIGCTSDIISVTATDPSGNSHTATGTLTISSGGGSSSAAIQIGSGSGGSFVNGTLTIGNASISAGGSSSVVANLVDTNGNLITSSTTVTFTSICVAAATATFTSSSVSTTTGTAAVTYIASGCVGTDTITATTTSQGSTISATGNISVAAPALGSIQFTSNTESIIALAGTGSTTGIPENSVVTFTVLDGTGAPLSGVTVNFTLNTSIGGIALAATSAVSNASGLVLATVQSGSVATSVRVTATVSGSALSTQSTPIVVSTGLPDQGSMSLSAASLNPRGWNIDGITDAITVRLADRYNNPIQNGTSVLFTTELGSIVGSCATTNGACTVNWTSQAPRGDSGRTTILATVLGEEDFVDVDSNGIFSNGDSFTDLPEAFLDTNENGIHDSGEFFTDLNTNTVYDGVDGLYNGVNCSHSTLCSTTKTVTVRGSLTLVMAEDYSTITNVNIAGVGNITTYPGTPLSINTRASSSATFRIVGLSNGQILPVGTKIDFTMTGASGTISAGASHVVTNTNANAITTPTIADYTVYFATSTAVDPNTTADGVLTLKITFPGGNIENYPPITITDQ